MVKALADDPHSRPEPVQPFTLILASTSRYRRDLLERLRLPFECLPPGVDESPLPGESPADTAMRLARAKASAIRVDGPALVIGSDQVAVLDGQPLGKPGGRARAIGQLMASSGRCVDFHTGLCVRDTGSGLVACGLDTTRVTFRRLTLAQVERYVDAEQPWDCAGSAKSEGLGVALIDRIEGRDPAALVGLPLMLLCDLLAEHGVHVL